MYPAAASAPAPRRDAPAPRHDTPAPRRDTPAVDLRPPFDCVIIAGDDAQRYVCLL